MAPSYSKLHLLTQLCSFFIKATFVYEKDIHNFLWVSAVDNFQTFAFLLHFCGNTAFTSLSIKFHKNFCFFLQFFLLQIEQEKFIQTLFFINQSVGMSLTWAHILHKHWLYLLFISGLESWFIECSVLSYSYKPTAFIEHRFPILSSK